MDLRYGMTSNNSIAYNRDGICPLLPRGRMFATAYQSDSRAYRLVDFAGTKILVPSHPYQVTTIHLKIGYPQISSTGTWSSYEWNIAHRMTSIWRTRILVLVIAIEMRHCLGSTMGTWWGLAIFNIAARLHGTHVMDFPLMVRSRQHPRVRWCD